MHSEKPTLYTMLAFLGAIGLKTLVHSERPRLYTILAFLSAIGLRVKILLLVFMSEIKIDLTLKK